MIGCYIFEQSKQSLDVEHTQLKVENDKLRDKMIEGREKQMELEQRIREVEGQRRLAESSASSASSQLVKENQSLQSLMKAKQELEENLHRIEIENAKIDAALKHERQRSDMLQREYNSMKQVRDSILLVVLESLCTTCFLLVFCIFVITYEVWPFCLITRNISHLYITLLKLRITLQSRISDKEDVIKFTRQSQQLERKIVVSSILA